MSVSVVERYKVPSKLPSSPLLCKAYSLIEQCCPSHWKCALQKLLIIITGCTIVIIIVLHSYVHTCARTLHGFQ